MNNLTIKNKLSQIEEYIQLFYQNGKLINAADLDLIEELKADYIMYSLMLKVINTENGTRLLDHLGMTEQEAIDAINEYDLDFLMCVCSYLNIDYSFFLPFILQQQIKL